MAEILTVALGALGAQLVIWWLGTSRPWRLGGAVAAYCLILAAIITAVA